MEENNTPVSKTPALSDTDKPSIVVGPKRAAKPQVEGINAPYLNTTAPSAAQKTNKLTESEIKIIKEVEAPQKIFATGGSKIGGPQITLKTRNGKNRQMYVLVILVLLAAGVVIWKYNPFGKNRKETSNTSQSTPPTNTTQNPAVSPAPTAATTSVSGAASTPPKSPASTPPISGQPATLGQLKVTATPTGYLNVRTLPSFAGTIITQVHPGETYSYSDKQTQWYKITLDNGTVGWVNLRYIQKLTQ